MTINYLIKPELNAVIATADGVLNFKEILAYYNDLLIDPDFQPHFHRIFDYRKVIEIDLSAEELKNIALQAEIGDEEKGKTVIIPNEGFSSTTIGKLYSELANSYRGRDHLLFTSPEEAIQWLGALEQ
ncbi:MAG: hypothetical protein HOE97_08255 [Rhodospirillaceae bacterium]|nr:hypothetical protein [Rhodospirillaceae bacterium]